MRHPLFLLIILGIAGNAQAANITRELPGDTSKLLSHRWLVTSTEKAGKKTGATAGENKLYMNFFSNGGFDFVGMGDGDMMVWKYSKGIITISRKSDPLAAAEATYQVEKLSYRQMTISGSQTGVSVRYLLTHGPQD